jgi:hypothetical protein
LEKEAVWFSLVDSRKSCFVLGEESLSPGRMKLASLSAAIVSPSLQKYWNQLKECLSSVFIHQI